MGIKGLTRGLIEYHQRMETCKMETRERLSSARNHDVGLTMCNQSCPQHQGIGGRRARRGECCARGKAAKMVGYQLCCAAPIMRFDAVCIAFPGRQVGNVLLGDVHSAHRCARDEHHAPAFQMRF